LFNAGGSNTGSSFGAAVGAVLGVLAAVVAVTAVLVVAFLLWRRNRKYSFTNSDRTVENPTYGGDIYNCSPIRSVP